MTKSEITSKYYERRGIDLKDDFEIITSSEVQDNESQIKLLRLRLSIYEEQSRQDTNDGQAFDALSFGKMIDDINKSRSKKLRQFNIEHHGKIIIIYFDAESDDIVADYQG